MVNATPDTGLEDIEGAHHAVVIAGGGPTGMMLAAELKLAGVDALVVERRVNQDLDDPFPARHFELLRPFRRAVDVPLAVGEDRAGVDDFVPLLGRDEVDYIRIDTTVCGGITEFLRVAALAATRGRLLSPHVFPELHVHLAAGVPNVLGVETVGADSPVTPIYRLLEPLEVRAGVATPPERPGIGLVFDDDALAHYAVI